MWKGQKLSVGENWLYTWRKIENRFLSNTIYRGRPPVRIKDLSMKGKIMKLIELT